MCCNKQNLKKVIENQNKIIHEVLEIKRRVIGIENNENVDKDFGETIIKRIIEQKDILENRIVTIDATIKLIDDKLNAAEKERKRKIKSKIDLDKPKQCEFDRTGYCKLKQSCPLVHASEICETFVVIGVCSEEGCQKRHPKNCYNFIQSKCRWGYNCRYLHKEQIIQIIKKNEKNKPLEEDNVYVEEEVVQNNEIDITNDAIKCDKCTAREKCISCIMKHVYADHDDSIPDTEQCLDESIETILKKARAFKMDESMDDVEDFV